jgi:hypothetical protein
MKFSNRQGNLQDSNLVWNPLNHGTDAPALPLITSSEEWQFKLGAVAGFPMNPLRKVSFRPMNVCACHDNFQLWILSYEK